MLSIYVVSSWVLLQVLAVTWEALGFPHKSITYLIIILLAGFPIFIFLVWKFQIVPLWKKENNIEEEKKAQINKFHKTYFSALGVISTLCVITIFLIVGNTFSKPAALPAVIQSDKIAVLKFGNNTGDSKYDIVSKMAADWVIHGITENHLGQVISQDVISQYSEMLKDGKLERNQNDMVREFLKPAKVISGNFYLNKDQLIFQSSISDEKTNKTLISFKNTSCNAENPLDCVKDLSESITGYLVTSSNKKLMLQDTPPKYEAYKYLLEAKSTDADEEHIALLNKAISIDPDYFEPKVFRVAYYFNQSAYIKADSLLKLIKPDSHRNYRQLNLLNMYGAILKGDNRKAYETILKEYTIAPFDLVTNKTAMVLALQFVNKPKEVEDIYNVINSDSIDFQNCSNCVERAYIKALADVQLKNYDRAIYITQKVLIGVDTDLLKRPLIAALVRSGKNAELNEFLFKAELSSTPEQLHELYLISGREYLLNDRKITADIYLNKAKKLDSAMSEKEYLAETLFNLEDFDQAEKEYKKLNMVDPKNIDFLGKLAISNYMRGNKSEAEKNLQSLQYLRGVYQFGEVDYILAQYNALAKNEEAMYHQLLKSIAEGHLFTSSTFQNDPIFRKYINTDKFQNTINFWH